MNRKRLFFAVAMLAICAAPVPAWLAPALALQRDRDQPLRIDAASANLDEKTGVAIYRGKVVLTQGSLRIDADRVEVRTRNQRLETAVATGHPARFRALLDGSEDEFTGSAARLAYRADSGEVELTGEVTLNRGGDRFNADYARYELNAQRLNARGTDTTGGRAYVLIRPRTEDRP